VVYRLTTGVSMFKCNVNGQVLVAVPATDAVTYSLRLYPALGPTEVSGQLNRDLTTCAYVVTGTMEELKEFQRLHEGK
jgi:hypothetical protein